MFARTTTKERDRERRVEGVTYALWDVKLRSPRFFGAAARSTRRQFPTSWEAHGSGLFVQRLGGTTSTKKQKALDVWCLCNVASFRCQALLLITTLHSFLPPPPPPTPRPLYEVRSDTSTA